MKVFLEERGCTLSEKKTAICRIEDGFTFMSQTYIRKGGYIYSYPSEKAVERFISNIRETILTSHKSQRDLITLLNQKLRGWANYHRFSDAEEAFRRVDAAVQTALLEASLKKHPRLPKAKVISKYWYEEADGRHCYALPEDKSVRVIRLADTLILKHSRVKTNANPYVEPEYLEYRTRQREISNVTGKYRAVWERQKGRCFYCGRPILTDQPRTVVQVDFSSFPSIRNSAYIHKICEQNHFELVYTMEDVDLMRPFDILSVLHEIGEKQEGARQTKGEITSDWKHIRLKRYIAESTAATINLTFKEIEEIEGKPLPKTAYNNHGWWYPRSNFNTIAEAWRTEGYSLRFVDLRKKKLSLTRDENGVSRLRIPKALTEKRLPDDAIYELERHMDYVIKKYGL